MPRYKATRYSLQVPRIEDGKVSKTSNILVVGGKTAELSEAEAAPFVEIEHLELVREDESAKPEEAKPEEAKPEGGQYPQAPGQTANLEAWQEAARVRGLDTGGSKAELRKRVEEFDAEQEKAKTVESGTESK